MKYLLDTHTLVWAIFEKNKLSKKVIDLIELPENQILVSAVSFWEISIKFALGKLVMEYFKPEDLPSICLEMDFKVIPLDAMISATYHQLDASYHRDPFDRMLIWQAKNLGLKILSKDDRIKMYESIGIQVIW